MSQYCFTAVSEPGHSNSAIPQHQTTPTNVAWSQGHVSQPGFLAQHQSWPSHSWSPDCPTSTPSQSPHTHNAANIHHQPSRRNSPSIDGHYYPYLLPRYSTPGPNLAYIDPRLAQGPLSDSTTYTNNSPTRAETWSSASSGSNRGRKRATDALPSISDTRKSKRRKTDRKHDNTLSIVGAGVIGVPGVGPFIPRPTSIFRSAESTTPSALTPNPPQSFPTVLSLAGSRRFGSIITRKKNRGKQIATNVWYFMRPLSTSEQPPGWQKPDNEAMLVAKPSMPYVGCKLCSEGDNPQWRTWKCVNGQTSAITHHLEISHARRYQEEVIKNKLKGWEGMVKPSDSFSTSRLQLDTNLQRDPFTLEGFHERLVRWIVVDDQSMNVLECPELRNLLLYVGIELREKDIPHRTRLIEMIVEWFDEEYKKMVDEIGKSPGRISFTSDMWSSPTYTSFMAVTAHYMTITDDGYLALRSQLIAFRRVLGSHSGFNLAASFVHILNEVMVANRVAGVTLDNASNCNSMMEEVARLLSEGGISFDEAMQRLRCFPHVCNIAVKAGLKHLTTLSPLLDPDLEELLDDDEINWLEILQDDPAYVESLKSDVVKRCRDLVTALRSSGQRREALRESIAEVNRSIPEEKEKIPDLALLKDVDTRWSSTFLMIDRVLLLYNAIEHYLTAHPDVHRGLSNTDLHVLCDIRQFLYIFHTVQELVSAEKTPTLPVVLPLYEKLIGLLKKAMNGPLRKLTPAIKKSINKLAEYLQKSRQSRLYALAMVINPTIKLKFIEANWTSHEISAAKQWIHDAMIQHSCAIPLPSQQPTSTSVIFHNQPLSFTSICSSAQQSPSADGSTQSWPLSRLAQTPPSHAAQAQLSALARLEWLEEELERDLESPQSLDNGSPTPIPQVSADEQHCLRVEAELRSYIEAGLLCDPIERATFDIVRFWEHNQSRYPILFRVALDVLPVQASSVPCERIFSSSKETTTARRNNIDPALLEILQIYKFLTREWRLDFNNNWISHPSELEDKSSNSCSALPSIRDHVHDLLGRKVYNSGKSDESGDEGMSRFDCYDE